MEGERGRDIKRETDRQTDGQRQAERQPGRQTEKQTDRNRDRQTDTTQIDKLRACKPHTLLFQIYQHFVFLTRN